mgnify:CR=1 FL=1
MPKSLSAGNAAAVAASVKRPVHLAELDFDSGFTRVASANFDIAFDSNGDTVDEVFLGREGCSVSAIEQTTEIKTSKILLQISGINPALLSLALTARYQGRRASLWRGFLDADWQLVAPPYLLFRGLMDTMPIKRGRTGTIGVTVVNRFARWESGMDTPRRDDADHQSRRPGDLFFQFVPQLVAGQETTWGRG